MKKIELPKAIADELADFARRSGRSTGFLARRVLAAAQKSKLSVEKVADPTPFALALDEDDDPKTLARVAELAGADPGATLAAAWRATRPQFLAWLAKQEAADRAASADDLDRALAEASSEKTPAERLAELASHEYVQVRARVAGNPKTPQAAVEKLAKEREKVIQAAIEKRR